LVHRLHAVVADRGLDLLEQAAGLAELDELGHLRRRLEHLERGDHTAAVLAFDQFHRHHALENLRQLRPDLTLLIGREGIEDAIHGLDGVVGMQRREHEVSGLGGGDHRAHRLGIAHLAHHDDVGILPQRVAQRFGEARGVGADFALRDRRHVVGEQELHRILDGDHMHRAARRDKLDHRRERRRLAAAGGGR
jgi:hypothetical protein